LPHPAGLRAREVGKGYAPMQLRLRIAGSKWARLHRHRAARARHECEHAKQRETFGVKLAERQAIQWWIADISPACMPAADGA